MFVRFQAWQLPITRSADMKSEADSLHQPGKGRVTTLLLLVLLLSAAGARAGEPASAPTTAVWPITPLEAPGLHNLFALGTNLFSGGTPEAGPGFEALAKLGVKIIISVDGAAPDVDTARKHGIRYVHLPLGYDGISTDQQRLLAKAGRELNGPIYVHCHHGKHRGPAAVAIICLADHGWSTQQAEAFLAYAGTSTNYPGLYQAVRQFQAPTAQQLEATPANFPERASVSGLVEAMVKIDEHWERLKQVRAAGYVTPKEHPDIVPANETVILWEHYREAQRLPEVRQEGPDLVERFGKAEVLAKEVEGLLRLFGSGGSVEIKAQLDKRFDALAKDCSTCHKAYRDPAGIKSKQ